jgi:hypothetical protein
MTIAKYKAPGTGAVNRDITAKLGESVSVKDFGAVGDAVTDDTAAIQAAIDHVILNRRGALLFPATAAGNFYKTTAPLVVNKSIYIRGEGQTCVTIMGVGLTAGQFVLDADCLVVDTVDHLTISGLTLRSLDGVSNGLRLKNVAYANIEDVRTYNTVHGVVLEGARCFSHSYKLLTNYLATGSGFRFAPGFIGGGQYVFDQCTFYGATGFDLPATAFVDNISFVGCNWEQCLTNSMFIAGTLAGLSVVGSRTEGCDGIDFVLRPFGAAEYIGGVLISGCIFGASDAGAATRIRIGGDSGKVRGFQITGNSVTHGTNSYSGCLVEMNGEGESGQISGNYLRGTTATVVNTQRAGVVVFANENITGKLAEFWGTANWGVDQGDWAPTDGSGASLGLTASGRYTKIGRMVMWQAFIQYPVTANASAAEIVGLPFAVGGLTGNTPGRSGGVVNVTNLGSPLGILQGITSTTEFAFYNSQSGAAITNADMSGKYVYCSGTYSL